MNKKIFITGCAIAATTFSFAQNSRQDSMAKEAEKTEVWTPVPAIVTPGKTAADAPSDAIVLFDGTNSNQWELENGAPAKFEITDGAMTVVKKSGSPKTKKQFTNFQLHLEWREPLPVRNSSQSRGNSGVFMQEQYELQVLDSYDNITYPNGQCGAIYKQSIPLVNACRKPGEWQSYDVIWTAPKFNADRSLQSAARVTVLQNGVLIQNNFEVKGPTGWIGKEPYKSHGPKSIMLQDHGDDGNPVSFRNIWVRPL